MAAISGGSTRITVRYEDEVEKDSQGGSHTHEVRQTQPEQYAEGAAESLHRSTEIRGGVPQALHFCFSVVDHCRDHFAEPHHYTDMMAAVCAYSIS